MMNAIELLNAVLPKVFPAAEINLLEPLKANGFWSMDIRLADFYLSVEWREGDGFGLTADQEHGFGEGADEVYPDLSGALPRIIHLVQNQLETVPPYPVRIKELREKLGHSQTEIAKKMGVQQAAISKLESRGDTHVATLRKYLETLGADLVMTAVFKDREEVIQLVGSD